MNECYVPKEIKAKWPAYIERYIDHRWKKNDFHPFWQQYEDCNFFSLLVLVMVYNTTILNKSSISYNTQEIPKNCKWYICINILAVKITYISTHRYIHNNTVS